ncbi:hypothetical protein AALP_AAs64726U000100, partial [Arabis alpina]
AHQKAMETCPFSSISKSEESALSVSLPESYVGCPIKKIISEIG